MKILEKSGKDAEVAYSISERSLPELLPFLRDGGLNA
jgi:hypothetical protein